MMMGYGFLAGCVSRLEGITVSKGGSLTPDPSFQATYAALHDEQFPNEPGRIFSLIEFAVAGQKSPKPFTYWCRVLLRRGDDFRLCGQVAPAPHIQCYQRLGTGAHGMRHP
jgi:hypothetical protein